MCVVFSEAWISYPAHPAATAWKKTNVPRESAFRTCSLLWMHTRPSITGTQTSTITALLPAEDTEKRPNAFNVESARKYVPSTFPSGNSSKTLQKHLKNKKGNMKAALLCLLITDRLPVSSRWNLLCLLDMLLSDVLQQQSAACHTSDRCFLFGNKFQKPSNLLDIVYSWKQWKQSKVLTYWRRRYRNVIYAD